jgi:hypothetical protein
MSSQSLIEKTVLQSPEMTVVAAHDGHGHARLDVSTTGYGRGSADGGRLVCQAVHEARLRNEYHVEFALNASAPACGAILEALHAETGNDVESIEMRRAGSSVMVSLELTPLPTAPRLPVADAPPHPLTPGRARRSGRRVGAVAAV